MFSSIMNDVTLINQDINKPNLNVSQDNFEQSLANIGLKIKDLQDELFSYRAKAKHRQNSFKDAFGPRLLSKHKVDRKSKENRSYIPSQETKKVSKKTSVQIKEDQMDFSSLLGNIYSATQKLRNIDCLERNTAIDHNPEKTKEIYQKIKRIFAFYGRSGDKRAPLQLSLSKYRKMMIDCNIVNSITLLEDLEVLFIGHNQHKFAINFETFLELLPKIAFIKFPVSRYTPSQSLDLLLSRYILPLNSQIESVSNQFNDVDGSINEEELLKEDLWIVIKSVYPALLRIYKEFFSWETKGLENIELVGHASENAYWNFLKEFGICPGMISKTAAQNFWTQYKKQKAFLYNLEEDCEIFSWFRKKDIGVFFTFSKFCEVLISLAILAYRNQGATPRISLNKAEQLAYFLEKLELSRGMAKFAGKGSLLVSKEILEKVISSL